MYRPNFCTECGTRIERARWQLWTSRRFCDACDTRFRARRLMLPALAAACLLAFGFTAGRWVRPTSPAPLTILRAPVAATTNALLNPPAPSSTANSQSAASPAMSNDQPKPYGSTGTFNERPTDPDEIVSICGARTKKGRPCSRRVRGTGRCWQHKGMPAMLPPSKLIVQG